MNPHAFAEVRIIPINHTTTDFCCCRDWNTSFRSLTIWTGLGLAWRCSTFFRHVTVNWDTSRKLDHWPCFSDGWTLFCSLEGKFRCFKSAWTRRQKQTLLLKGIYYFKFIIFENRNVSIFWTSHWFVKFFIKCYTLVSTVYHLTKF